MDHKVFVSTLPPETRAALLRKSDAEGLRHLALHWGMIVGFGTLIAVGVPGWPVLLLPQGLLIIFCFTLLHECVHKTPFASNTINETVMRVCALLIALPPEHFRYFHLAHHRHTNDPDHDPELQAGGADGWPAFLWRITGVPVWQFHATTIIRNALGRCDDAFIPERKRAAIVTEARLMMGIYAVVLAAIVAGQMWLLWCWIIPAILGQPFLRLYLMAEHGRCPAAANMFENTRTTLTNRAVRWLAWNMPFHAEHHAYPMVPFHQLPAFHRLAAAHLVNTSDGYIAYHRGADIALSEQSPQS